MNKLRSFRCISVLVLLCSQLSHADTLYISALKAVPRFENNKCWSDTGGRIKNVCATTQLISFLPDMDASGKTVTASVYSDAPFATLNCQHVALSASPTNYWQTGYMLGNKVGGVFLPAWQVPFGFNYYQIDCQVPAGYQLFGATIYF